MSFQKIQANPALRDEKDIERNEEWNNFMQRVGHVSGLVRDLASGDRSRSEVAQQLADKYLKGKLIVDDNIEMKVKENRTVINQKAFKGLDNNNSDTMDKDAWMAEVSKDAEKRFQDRKIRLEKADTLKTQAMKAFRREEYDKALSCYNRAIEQIRDNAMLYCDRALTNIKLGKYEKVIDDCDTALRLNENSYKARLYKAKAYKELDEEDKLQECKEELATLFPQHKDLTKYFLNKKQDEYEEEEEEN